MAPFLNLIAISSLAIIACSFGASPVTALATDNHRVRDIFPAHGHAAIAKKKRATATNSKRCKNKPKNKPSTTPKAVSKPKPKPKDYSNDKPKPSSSSSSAKSISTAYVPPSHSSGKGKVGLAWPNGNDNSLKNFKTDKVNYIYTWSPHIPDNAKALGLTPLPMLWGERQIGDFTRLVKKGYADIVLGFNEPNEPGQSNMDYQTGVRLWKQYIEPLRYQGYKLISPATSSNPNGMVWVKNFVDHCGDGCHFDGVSVHYYDITPEGFIKYIENWHNTFNVPVYPTEFACQNFNNGPQCSASQVHNFFTTIIDYMDNADWVPMYFAFGVMKQMQGVNGLNQLMNQNGQPTALGKQYIGA